ncbi:MAG: manganese catalase family protein [Bacilli bacterium]
MWLYEKKLEYPVNISKKDLKMAKYLMALYGGPNGELAAAIQYLTQRYTMPNELGRALLTDIATEELNHVEIISSMISQLINGSTVQELISAGLDGYFVEHDHGVFPINPAGIPFTTAYINATGDFIADLESDMAAEQRARATYEHLMDLTDDPDILAPLSFLRQREIVHYQRFKELRDYYLKKKNTN